VQRSRSIQRRPSWTVTADRGFVPRRRSGGVERREDPAHQLRRQHPGRQPDLVSRHRGHHVRSEPRHLSGRTAQPPPPSPRPPVVRCIRQRSPTGAKITSSGRVGPAVLAATRAGSERSGPLRTDPPPSARRRSHRSAGLRPGRLTASRTSNEAVREYALAQKPRRVAAGTAGPTAPARDVRRMGRFSVHSSVDKPERRRRSRG
jgi:hypothetical protein